MVKVHSANAHKVDHSESGCYSQKKLLTVIVGLFTLMEKRRLKTSEVTIH